MKEKVTKLRQMTTISESVPWGLRGVHPVWHDWVGEVDIFLVGQIVVWGFWFQIYSSWFLTFLQHYFPTMFDQAVEFMPCWFILCIITLLWIFKYIFMGFHVVRLFFFCISQAYFFLCSNTVFNAGTDDDTFKLLALLLFCEFLKMLLCFYLWNHTLRFKI